MAPDTKNGKVPVLTPPKAILAVKDRVQLMDRDYFLAHPGELQVERPFIPGECWPDLVVYDLVRVTKVTPDFRLRQPFMKGVEYDGC